jgi:hypothetical protein
MEHAGQRAEHSPVAPRERVVTDLAEYCDLMVSRRPLKRVTGRPGCLLDTDSNEVFRPSAALDLRVSESA